MLTVRGVVAIVLVSVAACGPSSRRSIDTPAHAMTYDDACGLQDYFDQRRAASLPKPRAEDEVIRTDEKGREVGEGTYRLVDPLSRRRFARMLREEYSGIDEPILRAAANPEGEVLIHVQWWDAGQIRRLRPDTSITLTTSAGVAELPPNMCVTDLLFGDRIYELRAKYNRTEVDMATGKPTE